MKRVLNIAGSVLGVAALVVLAAALLLTFGGPGERPVAQEPGGVDVSGVSLQQSPATATVAPYPLLPTPTAVPSATPTPGPYPPPPTATAILPATPTPVPPPTATVTPPARPTFTPPPGPSRFRIVWAETTYLTSEERPLYRGGITFWMADVPGFAPRTILATMPQDYSLVRAKLSPDGSKIAFTTCTHDCRHRDAALWVVNTDGTGLKRLVPEGRGQSLDAYEIIWSLNSKALAYMKMVPEDPPPGDKVAIPFPIFEIYAVDVDSGERKLLVSDDTTPGINLLGWSAEGAVLYARAAPEGYGLWAVSRGGPPEFRGLIASEPWSISPSPNGTKLVSNSPEGLIYLSVDGKERRVLAPPEQPFGGIWSPDGAEIIGRNIGLELKALNVHTKESRGLGVRLMDVADKLLSISPDKQWVAIRNYQDGEIYLFGLGNNAKLKVPSSTDLRHASHFVGWMPVKIP